MSSTISVRQTALRCCLHGAHLHCCAVWCRVKLAQRQRAPASRVQREKPLLLRLKLLGLLGLLFSATSIAPNVHGKPMPFAVHRMR
jgi:hypothetical protein